MSRIDILKKSLGQVDLGKGRRSTLLSPTADCLTQLSKFSVGNIDKDGRYWHGEIEISVEITSYHSRQLDYTRRYGALVRNPR